MKTCIQCDIELTGKWQDKFCSRACSNRSRKGNRICLHCGGERKFGTKYCSVQCQQDHQHTQYIQRWHDGKEDGKSGKWGISGHIRRWLHEKQDDACSLCGWNVINEWTEKVPLEIDHEDGDWSNNRPKNLRLICPNCHSLTPNHGARNKGNGRYNSGKPQPVPK